MKDDYLSWLDSNMNYKTDWRGYINNSNDISNDNLNKELLEELFFEKINIDISELENWIIISSKTAIDTKCNFSIISIKEAWVKEFKLYVKTIDHRLFIFADPNYDSNWIDKEEIIEVVNKLINNVKQLKENDNLIEFLKRQLYDNLSINESLINKSITNNNIIC